MSYQRHLYYFHPHDLISGLEALFFITCYMIDSHDFKPNCEGKGCAIILLLSKGVLSHLIIVIVTFGAEIMLPYNVLHLVSFW